MDESHLTGESEEMIKSMARGTVLMLSGSRVHEGFGRMMVVAVGPYSQQGRINTLVMQGKGGATAAAEEGGAAGGVAGAGGAEVESLSEQTDRKSVV